MNILLSLSHLLFHCLQQLSEAPDTSDNSPLFPGGSEETEEVKEEEEEEKVTVKQEEMGESEEPGPSGTAAAVEEE